MVRPFACRHNNASTRQQAVSCDLVATGVRHQRRHAVLQARRERYWRCRLLLRYHGSAPSSLTQPSCEMKTFRLTNQVSAPQALIFDDALSHRLIAVYAIPMLFVTFHGYFCNDTRICRRPTEHVRRRPAIFCPCSDRAENVAKSRALFRLSMPKARADDAASTNVTELLTISHLCPCCNGRMLIIGAVEHGSILRQRPLQPTRRQDRYVMSTIVQSKRRKDADLYRGSRLATMTLARTMSHGLRSTRDRLRSHRPYTTQVRNSATLTILIIALTCDQSRQPPSAPPSSSDSSSSGQALR